MFFKYISVGLINTLLTLIVTFFCYKVLNIDYKIAYAIGFFIGFLNSLILNNIYTFKKNRKNFDLSYLLKYTTLFLVSFLASELVLLLCVEEYQLDELVSIFLAMLTYTLFSYFLFKKYVFSYNSKKFKGI
ncbi:MAG TPA: GtrA family protein [Arcobacter sp.]|nr:GtrA family protein [Arcobacter sp.]